jgi:hypothetical protein
MDGAKALYPAVDDAATRAQSYRNSSLTGIAIEKLYKIADKITGGYINERNLRIQADAARMLVAQGADRDAVVQALLQFARRNNLTGQRRAAIDQVVRAVTTAPRQALIEAANE